ncbi:LPXTG cell wall anchor domain-containing protein [Lactobacillus delbrueckii subsp. bulgaricus]
MPQAPRLPQTGQLNWPIPLLALAGLTLFIWGWAEQKKGER